MEPVRAFSRSRSVGRFEDSHNRYLRSLSAGRLDDDRRRRSRSVSSYYPYLETDYGGYYRYLYSDPLDKSYMRWKLYPRSSYSRYIYKDPLDWSSLARRRYMPESYFPWSSHRYGWRSPNLYSYMSSPTDNYYWDRYYYIDRFPRSAASYLRLPSTISADLALSKVDDAMLNCWRRSSRNGLLSYLGYSGLSSYSPYHYYRFY